MRKITGMLLAAVLTLGSAGTCLAAEEEASDKIQLTFMGSGTGNYAENRKKELEGVLLEDFPNIEIIMETYPEEQYYSILNTRLSMGDGPDFFNIQPYWAGPNAVQKLAPAGYLEPLEEFPVIANASEEEKAPVSWNGHVYSLSRGGMILCTYYNKKIFEKYGISIPRNWTEFLEVCEHLKKNGVTPIISGNKDGYALQFGLYQIAACQVYADNPDYNQQLEDGTVRFTDSGTWDTVIDRYLLLYQKKYVQEHSLAIGSAEAAERFGSGEAAMMFGGNFNYSVLSEYMDEEELGAFSLPANENGEPVYGVISNGGGMAVYAGGTHVELCKKIIQKILESGNTGTSSENESMWSEFEELQESGRYTINCNQGWKGDVEWILEDGVSRKIGGEDISTDYITDKMQKAYDEG